MGRHRLRQSLLLIVAALALGYAGLWMGQQLGHDVRASSSAADLALSRAARLGLGISGLLTIPIFLLAHELGHLVAGWFVGFRAFLLVIGPVRIERGDARWQWHLNTDIRLAGGLAGTAPTDASNLRVRSAVMIAGGPIASLLLGLAGLVGFWLVVPARLEAGVSVVQMWATVTCGALGAGSLLIAIVTLLPFSAAGFLSDGARLLRLRRPAVAERDVAIMAIVGMSMAGRRPRDWDRSLIDAAVAPNDGSVFEVTAWMLAQAHAADRGDDAEARRWLDRILANIAILPSVMHAGTRLYAATQLALWGDALAARAQLDAVAGTSFGAPVARPLAEAAVLVAEGRVADLADRWPSLRALVANGIDRGSAKMMLDIIGELERRAVSAT
ncbi:MAG: hypothetical protein KAY59_07325 [Acidobacteria bacterium]|nr:hypothetical protein [Acidobacteriota bacterium]MBP8274228.1 hypothetical protein [Acidobacteriota bacterium]